MEASFNVMVADENEAPFDLNSTTVLRFAENQPIGTVVGQFAAVDPEEVIVFIDQWSWRRIE